MATLELIVSEFIVLALVCFFLIRHYKGNMVTLDVAVAVYLSWVLGFAGILLLPYDISVAVVDNTQSDTLEKVWNFIYWSTFVLAWVVLPVQMEYHNSGHFTFLEKLKDALRRNLWSGVLACVAGIVYVVYMMATSSGSLTQVVGFVKAMGNTYGILLITVLMGNGLVGIPRRMWNYADVDMELNSLYMMASSIETSYQEARFELEDCEWDVSKAAEKIKNLRSSSDDAVSTAQHMLILEQSIANFSFLSRSTTRKYVTHSTVEDNAIVFEAKKSLIELHGRLKQSQIRASACERRWKHIVLRCERAELALIDEFNSTGEENINWCSMSTETETENKTNDINTQKNYFLRFYSKIKKWLSQIFNINRKYIKLFCRFSSVICSIVSIIILWSELVMAFQWKSPVGYLMGAYSPQREKNAVVMQAVSFLALSYMSICTYWSLFRLNLGWAYSLQGPQLSPPASLIFNGEYFSRLQFALGYNFLTFLSIPRTKLTSFDQLMSNMNMVPVFGTSFQVYIPIVMILVALMTILNVHARVLRLIGVESDDSFVQMGGFNFTLKCCNCNTRTKVALSDEDLERYEAGKKLVSGELRSAALAHSASHNSIHMTTQLSTKSMDRSLYSQSRDSDISCHTNDEKDEAPYRDEEPDDDTDNDNDSALEFDAKYNNYTTDGNKNYQHKKSSSINYMNNNINPMQSKRNEKYSNVDLGPNLVSNNNNRRNLYLPQTPMIDDVVTNSASASLGSSLVSKFTDFFSSKIPSMYQSSGEAVNSSLGLGLGLGLGVGVGGIDDRNSIKLSDRNGISGSDKRVAVSSTLLPLRDSQDIEYGVQFNRFGSGSSSDSGGKGGGKSDGNGKDCVSNTKFQRSINLFPVKERKTNVNINFDVSNNVNSNSGNFGLEDDKVEYTGRRYANI